ncbi:MAG: TRAP transporter large permease, partial [Pseudomonadota bacterium]
MGSEIIPLLFGGFLLLLFIGAPITVALGVSTLITFLFLDENPIKFVQIAFTSVGSFPLMALPAFILAGALMEASGLSRRLINVAESFAGPFTGGMSAATVMACLFFGAISGSGPATTAAVGMLMIPAMIDRGYSRGFASAITASSGGLGIVIPPSIPLIIFGIAALGMPAPPEAVAEHGQFQTVSIPKLFIAGFMPAFLIAGSLLLMNYILAKKNNYRGSTEGWSAREIWCEMYRGFWALMAPVVILGGIYSGFFTPTEAAIVAIFYTLVVGAFIYRELSWPKLFEALETTTWLTGRVLLIMFTATVFGRLLVENQVPAVIAQGMLSFTDNIYVIWTLVIFFLLFVGMFME